MSLALIVGLLVGGGFIILGVTVWLRHRKDK